VLDFYFGVGMLIISTNKSALLRYREETVGGKTYVVAEGVPLVQGVLNERYVAADDFAAVVEDCNGVPVVIRHPKENGGSARVPKPDVPDVGRFYNATRDGDRLVGEFWLDKAELLKSSEGQLIYNRIRTGAPTEVSTAYSTISLQTTGVYNEKQYFFQDKDLHPDHIALLPDEVGACSLKDGCGLMRNCDSPLPTCPCQVIASNVTGNLPDEAKKQWEAVYSKAKADGDDAAAAAQKAWGAVEAAGWQKKDGTWVHNSLTEESVVEVEAIPFDAEMVEVIKLFANYASQVHS
jgi:hypothetical protein